VIWWLHAARRELALRAQTPRRFAALPPPSPPDFHNAPAIRTLAIRVYVILVNAIRTHII